MPSAFRRAGAKSAAATASRSSSLSQTRGVKPWTGGIHLTSVGLHDLDAILGGGQPLGTCILLQEDRWTRDLALSLVKYWCAEAISQEHQLLIPVANDNDENSYLDDDAPVSDFCSTTDAEDLLSALPRNLHWDKQKKKEDARNLNQNDGEREQMTIVEEEDDEDDEAAKADEGLQIAWQYRKSVQQERLGHLSIQPKSSSTSTSSVFCHSYDLSGRMRDQTSVDASKYIIVLPSTRSCPQQAGFKLFRQIVKLLQAKEGSLTRLLLFHPKVETVTIALPLILAYIRAHSLAAVVFVCTPPLTNHKLSTQLSRASDVVLATEGFASRQEYPPPAEFRHLQGLLTLRKVSTVTAATANGGGFFADLTISKRPTAYIYGFKRDRRKLHIPLLHIPPEDYAEGGGSVGSGVRSGAGKAVEKKSTSRVGCSSNASGGSNLDF